MAPVARTPAHCSNQSPSELVNWGHQAKPECEMQSCRTSQNEMNFFNVLKPWFSRKFCKTVVYQLSWTVLSNIKRIKLLWVKTQSEAKISVLILTPKYFIIKFIAELETQNSFQSPSPIFSTNLKEFFLIVFMREMQFPLFYQQHWWLYPGIDLTRVFSSATHWISVNWTRAPAITL